MSNILINGERVAAERIVGAIMRGPFAPQLRVGRIDLERVVGTNGPELNRAIGLLERAYLLRCESRGVPRDDTSGTPEIPDLWRIEGSSVRRARTIASLRVRDQVEAVTHLAGLSLEVQDERRKRLKVMVSRLKELDGNDHIGFAQADAALHNESVAGLPQERSVLIASYELSVFMALYPAAVDKSRITAWHEIVANQGLRGDQFAESFRNPYHFAE